MADADGPSDDFKRRLAAAKAARPGGEGQSSGTAGLGPEAGKGLGLALRIGVDLVAAVAVGTGLGYAIDRWLGSAPWVMIAGLFLGTGAGIMSVYRAVMGMGYAVGYKRPAPKPPGDPEEKR
jgi:ATP synthase protein I